MRDRRPPFDFADFLLFDLAAAGPDDRESPDVLAPASTVFARIAASFALKNPEASDGAVVEFASECLVHFLAATGARPYDVGWILDLDPHSIADEFFDGLLDLHRFLVDLTPPGLARVRLVTSGDERLSEPPGDADDDERDNDTRTDNPTPERANHDLPPTLTLLDGGGSRTPFGFGTDPKDSA